MIEFRERWNIDYVKMAKKLHISPLLVSMVEDGHVTHPNIARRMQKLYGLTEEESYELMPPNYRPNGGMYDPDMFRAPEDRQFVLFKKPYDEYESYERKDKRWMEAN